MGSKFSRNVKKKALQLGAAVVGIADAGLYEKAPEKHRPGDILENATGVISIGIPMPGAVLQQGLPTQYTRCIFTSTAILDQIALQLSMWLEREGFDAIPITARGPLYMDALSGELRGDLSHKHTAMLAGLGEIGINTLLINPKYGTRLMLVSVVTNAPVQADNPFSQSVCLRTKCLKCISSCPVKALSPSGEIDKMRCSKYYRQFPEVFFETWGLYYCRECRKVCSKVIEHSKASKI